MGELARAPSQRAPSASRLDALLRSHEPGHSLEGYFYTHADVLEAELKRIFRPGWLMACHAGEIPRAGDYVTFDHGRESIIVLRDLKGEIRAFQNLCRHRGSRLCEEAAGSARYLVCPYHRWTYGLDGRLTRTTWMGPNFDASAFSLLPVTSDEIEGLVFVNPGGATWDLEPMRRQIAPVLRPHALRDTRIAHRLRYVVPANWKLVVENQRECYHCPGSHPEYLQVHYDADIDNPEKLPGIEARIRECSDRWVCQGIDVSSVSASSAYTGAWFRANRTPFRPGCVTESLDGRPVAPLLGQLADPDAGTARVGTYLNFWLHATSDHAAVIQYRPLSATETELTATWLVRRDAREGADYDVERLVEFTRIQLEQDRQILERQGRGVRSPHYAPGPYSLIKEASVERFVTWYLSAMRAGAREEA